MNLKSKIIAQVGSKQKLFEDRASYPSESCDFIENIIMCNLSQISKDGTNGRIRFTKENNLIVQMNILDGNCYLSDESLGIVLVRLKENNIKSIGYYGVEADFNFVTDGKNYCLDTVSSRVECLKSFYSSWKISSGRLGVGVIIVDDPSVFEIILNDSFFKDSYILCSY